MEETSPEAQTQNPNGESKNPKFWKNYTCPCGCGRGYGHGALKVILMIVIALAIFALGVMVGSHHSHSFGRRGFYQPRPMMRAYPVSGVYPSHPITPVMPGGMMRIQGTTTPTTSAK